MTDKGMEDRENLFETNQNIGYCKDSREKLIREINEVNKQLKNKSISKEDYAHFFSQRLDGKTRLEWFAFCDKYAEDKGKEVKAKLMAKAKPLIPISLVVIGLVYWRLAYFFRAHRLYCS